MITATFNGIGEASISVSEREGANGGKLPGLDITLECEDGEAYISLSKKNARALMDTCAEILGYRY